MNSSNHISLHSVVLEQLGKLCEGEGIPKQEGLVPGLVQLVDGLQAYREEGVRYHPDVLVTTSVRDCVAPMLEGTVIPIGQQDIEPQGDVFRRALKVCAPLSRGGWAIWVDLGAWPHIRYGVLFGDSTELSPGVFRQSVGDLATESGPPRLFFRSLGNRQVEIRGRQTAIVASLSLNDAPGHSVAVEELARAATRDTKSDDVEVVRDFVTRLLDEAVRETHGCLIAVVEDTPAALAQVKANWSDGVFLDPPLDLPSLVLASQEQGTSRASTAVRAHRVLFKGMVASDGITLLTTCGRVVAFNIFVGPTSVSLAPGGARARAYAQARASGIVEVTFSLSHDGTARCEGRLE